MDQQQLNKEMTREGRIRYWKKINDAKRRKSESSTPYGSTIIRASLTPMIESMKTWVRSQSHKKAGRNNTLLPIFKELDYEVLAFLTAKVCIDKCGTEAKYNSTVLKVGEAIEDELRFRYLKAKAPILWKRLKKQLDKSTVYSRKRAIIVLTMNRNNDVLPFEGFGLSTKARLGTTLIELFIQSTGVCETSLLTIGKKQVKYLTFKPDTMAWVEKFNMFREDLFPVWLPTSKPPINWESPFLGGYDSELFDGCTLVKTQDKDWLTNELSNGHFPDVYESINALQNTKWRINKRVLDVAESFFDIKSDMPGMSSIIEEEFPPKPHDIATNKDVRKKWRIQMRIVHERNITNRSKRLRVLRTLTLAKKFKKQKEFYFPFQLDFRGRAYCLASYLNPQSDDFGKSLLEFGDGKMLESDEAAKWLAIHGANVFGFDKVSFEDRVAWVNENRLRIEQSADDPLSNLWWSEADKPWQFLAFCFEWARYLKQGKVFMTHLPVQVDGTNNGLQILSLLTRDRECADSTNCSNQEVPADIYQDVADLTIELLKREKGEDEGLAKYWLEFGIDRKTTKRSVMILPYGGTFYSSNKYVEDWYREALEKAGESVVDEDLHGKRVFYLGKMVWEAVNKNVGRPLEAMRWMEICAKELLKHNLFVKWETPLGLPVKQNYINYKRHQVKTTMGDRVIKLSFRTDTDSIDSRRQVNGISPNFVHSLDASILHKTICFCNKVGVTSYNMIHDSFGSHCTDLETINAAVRVVIYHMFKGNLLLDLHAHLSSILPEGADPLPLPPEYGSFNIEEILSSEYLFS